MRWIEFGIGSVIGLWVLLVLVFGLIEMRARLRAMRIEADSVKQFRQENSENHKNGDDKVA